MGYYASKHLGRGQVILSETPLFSMSSTAPLTPVILLNEVNALSDDEKQAFVDLGEGTSYRKVISTVTGLKQDVQSGNDLQAGHYAIALFWDRHIRLSPDSDDCALFPTISFVNHSCNPNAEVYWDQGGNSVIIRAIVDIGKGQEVTI